MVHNLHNVTIAPVGSTGLAITTLASVTDCRANLEVSDRGC
jgi:hypothetical protein